MTSNHARDLSWRIPVNQAADPRQQRLYMDARQREPGARSNVPGVRGRPSCCIISAFVAEGRMNRMVESVTPKGGSRKKPSELCNGAVFDRQSLIHLDRGGPIEGIRTVTMWTQSPSHPP